MVPVVQVQACTMVVKEAMFSVFWMWLLKQKCISILAGKAMNSLPAIMVVALEPSLSAEVVEAPQTYALEVWI